MTALAPRFGFTGDATCFAGEALVAELAFTNGSDATIALEGRQFALTIWVAATRAEVMSVAAAIVSDSSGHYARFAISGDATEELFQTYGQLGLRLWIAEIVADGLDVKVEGALRVRSGPNGVTPELAQSIGTTSVSRYTFDASTRRTIVSARGAPGLSAAQQLFDAGTIGAPTAAAMDARTQALATAAAAAAQRVFIQPTVPDHAAPWIWWDTSGGNLTLWISDGVA